MTLGLDAARAVDPERFRHGGVAPRLALRPASREELSEALRAAAAGRLGVIPWGGGVALASGSTPGLAGYDLALDLTAFDRVIEYEPEDFTLTAECGVTISRLRELLASRGQELPLEGARAERATLGGVLAANASGPRRLRFGSPRDRILGARLALADGTLVRSGGKVVKNVAGYGTHRLLCGSEGALAVIVEASLKLAPAPERRVALAYRMDAAGLAERERWARFGRLEPAFLTVLGEAAAARLAEPRPGPGFTVLIGLEDDAPWVERQVAATLEALGPPLARLEGDAVRSLESVLADLEEQEGARLSFTTAQRTPAAAAPLLDRPAAARMVFHAAAGRLHYFPEASEAEATAHLAAGLGSALIGVRGVTGLAPAAAPQAALGPLRARLREALDPDRRFALGARWEGGFWTSGRAPDS